MMPIVLVVVSSDTRAHDTLAAVRALREAVGQSVSVLVEERDRLPDDVSGLLEATHAQAISELSWSDDGKRVWIGVAVRKNAALRTREVEFASADSAEARGRTVGFVVASMLPTLEQDALTEANPPLSAAPAVVPPAVARLSAPSLLLSSPGGAPDAVDTQRSTTGMGGDSEAKAILAAMPRGYGSGVGAEIGVGYRWSSHWSTVLSGAFRVGEIPPASATWWHLHLGAGLRWTSSATAPLRFAAHVKALVMREEASHLSPDDEAPVIRARLLPGAEFAAHGQWFFRTAAALTTAVGVETAFGNTTLLLHGRESARVDPFRIIAGLGLLVQF